MAYPFPDIEATSRRQSRMKQLKANGIPLDMDIPGILKAMKPGEENGEGQRKLPTIDLVANTGEPMDLPNYPHPVIVDMDGVEFASQTMPIILDHDTSRRFGHSLQQSVQPGVGIVANGVVSSQTEEAQEIVKDASNGYPFQVSIGAKVKDGFFVAAGNSVKVNGKTWQGPVIVSRKTLIREFTVTVLGADGKTSTRIAASLNGKDETMDFEKWAKDKGFDLQAMNDGQVAVLKAMWEGEAGDESLKALKASWEAAPKADPKPDEKPAPQNVDLKAQREMQAAEISRTSKLANLFASAEFSDIKAVKIDGTEMSKADFHAHAVTTGLSPSDVELKLFHAKLEHKKPEAPQAIHMESGFTFAGERAPLECQAIEAALVIHSSLVPAKERNVQGKDYGYEVYYKEEVLEAANKLGNVGLHELMGLVIRASGHNYHGRFKSDDYIRSFFGAVRDIQASPGAGPFSTQGVTNILENLANKVLLTAYNAQGVIWDKLARIRNVNDFKPISLYRLSSHGGYIKVGPNGELSHGKLSDEKYQVQAETFGMVLGLSRTDMRNDDLSAFESIAEAMGRQGALATEEEFWKVYLGMTPDNIISGPLGITGLTEAEQRFADQVDDDNKPILVNPALLIVGTGNKVLANQLANQVNLLDNSGETFVANPHQGKFAPWASPYVNNTTITDQMGENFSNQSETQWWLQASPSVLAYVNGVFLDGRRIPTVESGEVSFDTLGMQWRAFHDFGFAEGDPKAAVQSNGTGGS